MRGSTRLARTAIASGTAELELLSFDVGTRVRYCHTLPFEQIRRFGTLPKESWAGRWLPGLGGARRRFDQPADDFQVAPTPWSPDRRQRMDAFLGAQQISATEPR